jgi:hypothetical protein
MTGEVRRIYLDEDELASLGLAATYLTRLSNAEYAYAKDDLEELYVQLNSIDPIELNRVAQELGRLHRHASSATISVLEGHHR